MSTVKIIEISAESPKSFEDAVEKGIREASERLDGLKSAWVAEQKIVIDNGKPSAYRVIMRLSFELGEKKAA